MDQQIEFAGLVLLRFGDASGYVVANVQPQDRSVSRQERFQRATLLRAVFGISCCSAWARFSLGLTDMIASVSFRQPEV